jgi:hypothetical protein
MPPPGTQVAIFDVDATHRQMLTMPEDRLHVCVAWDGKVSVDHCCCFGCASSSSIFGRVADAAKAIFLWKLVDLILKWADDFSFWRFPFSPSLESPWSYRIDEDLIWSVADDLGWPWSPAKCKPFAFQFRYIGFDWSLEKKTVALPAEKKAKLLGKLDGWEASSAVDRKACLSVIGSLNHCSVIVLSSRSHLPSFYWMVSHFEIQIRPHPPELPKPFFVDASTSWGISLGFMGRWLAWLLLDGWQEDGREIGWAEFVALELAVLTALRCGISNATLVVRSDNQGVVQAFSAEYLRSPAQNTVLQWILLALYERGLWLQVIWIASADNPADGPSRGLFPPWNKLLSSLPKVPQILCPFVVPSVSAPSRASQTAV